MAINFPSSPTLNQTYTYGSQTWFWDATGWALYPTSLTNINPIVKVVAYSATPTLNWAGADMIRITLTGGNVTSSTFTGGVDGKKYILEITQDGSGSRTFAWPANVRFGTDITSITLSTTATKTDRIGFIYDQATGKYDVVAVIKGF